MPTTQASFMPLGFSSLLARGRFHADTSVGSQIVGDKVNILSTNDTNISGSTVFGTNGVIIDSEKGDVNIVAAEDKFNETHFSKTTKSG
ncbi:hemagglutinin repeat-containing protein, partial [Formosimonas limnophila]|uniref:hemagglutinin repeat-containing protein n=1 Tax=Formosimonas limnophila TaxID=1384487 RepID=UPI00167448A9